MVAKQWDEAAQDALDRMRRAHRRGSGCYLTAEMIQSLALTSIGEVWSDERPARPTTVSRPLPVARRARQRGADKLSSDPRRRRAKLLLEKFAAVQMIDVHLPTTDGRELVLTRYTEPEPEL